jgi:hypothetical protein
MSGNKTTAERIRIAKKAMDSVVDMFADATPDLCSTEDEQVIPRVANVSQQDFEKCWHSASEAWIELKLAEVRERDEKRAVNRIEQAVKPL